MIGTPHPLPGASDVLSYEVLQASQEVIGAFHWGIFKGE